MTRLWILTTMLYSAAAVADAPKKEDPVLIRPSSVRKLIADGRHNALPHSPDGTTSSG